MNTIYKTTQAKSLLRKQKQVDSWFISCYSMNLFRGCEHNCAYCDGRSEKYYVHDDFNYEIHVKENAPELLQKELDPKRKRKPLQKSFIFLGGGVSDSYQPAEERYEITKEVLKVVGTFDFPIHILTKSDLILRDLELLKHINKKSKVIVSFSFSTIDEKRAAIFEPGASTSVQRLEAISAIKNAGIDTGILLMPVIPFLSDSEEAMFETLSAAKKAGAVFVVFGGMTLKSGRQEAHFLSVVKEHFSDYVSKIKQLYKGNLWGGATSAYYNELHMRFFKAAKKSGLPVRIPPSLFVNYVSEQDRIRILLEHMAYVYDLHKKPHSFLSAAKSIGNLDHGLLHDYEQLKRLPGIGDVTIRFIKEIIKTSSCNYYESLLYWK